MSARAPGLTAVVGVPGRGTPPPGFVLLARVTYRGDNKGWSSGLAAYGKI